MYNIGETALFKGIDAVETERLLHKIRAEIRCYRRDEIVLSEGDSSVLAGIVLEGAVQVIREDWDGNRCIITSLEPGQLFGEALSCTGADCLPVTVMAAIPSNILLFDCNRLLCCNEQAARIAVGNLVRIIAKKNLLLRQKITILSGRTTQEKLMSYLHYESERQGKIDFEIPYDRQQLADYLGVERSAMSAEISKLARSGKIEVHRRNFRILSAEK